MRDALRLAAFQLLFLDRVPAYAVGRRRRHAATRTSRRAGGFVNAVLRRVATDGRARLAELGEGDAARAWSVGALVPAVAGEAAARGPRRRGRRGACWRPPTPLPSAACAPTGCAADCPAARRGAGRRGVHDARRRRACRTALLYDGPPLERSGAFRDGLVTPQSRGSQVAGMVAAGGVTGPARPSSTSAPRPAPRRASSRRCCPGAASRPSRWTRRARTSCARNLARLGADGVDVVRADALEPPPEWDGAFDAVLLDAPCSGLGTLASRADLRWRRHASDVPRLAQLQARLLARAAAAVRPGGALTYAVCTRDARRDARRRRAAARRRRLDRRRPRRGLAGAGAPGGRRLPARAAARRRLQRVLRRPPAPRRSAAATAPSRRARRRGRIPRAARRRGDGSEERWKTSCGASTWRRPSSPPTSPPRRRRRDGAQRRRARHPRRRHGRPLRAQHHHRPAGGQGARSRSSTAPARSSTSTS